MQDIIKSKRLYDEEIVRQIATTAVEMAVTTKVDLSNVKKFLEEHLSTIIDESVR